MAMALDDLTQLPASSVTAHPIDLSTCAMMTIGEAAMVLGIHRTTAWNLYKRGEFPVPVLKIGSSLRIVKVHLELFIETGVPLAFPTSTGSASIAS